MPAMPDDDALPFFVLSCPDHLNKLWFDEDSGEFYCPMCSYTLKDLIARDEYL